MQNCFITGTGLFTPNESISNKELVAAFNGYIDQTHSDKSEEERQKLYSSEAFIEKASGIHSRFVMNKSGVLDSSRMAPDIKERANADLSLQAEMAVKAAVEALKNANKTAEDIDCVIVACSNMQRPYPAIAIEVQAALGINGFAYDMNVACSSATFGIANAVSSIQNGMANCVLVLNPEICSGHLDFKDRDCHFIFGDACTATIIEKENTTSNGFEILGCKLATEMSNNIRNNFGFLTKSAPEHSDDRDKLFMQNGRSVFKEVCPMAAEHIVSHAQANDIEPSKLKRLWLHQANLSMNQLISKRVYGEVANEDKAPVILNEYANTSSAGSIIAFHKYHNDFATGDSGIICSFGAGYSIGSVLIKKA
jgi:beta-ketodecanoyl-[acyl-carrier-protein] synthase